MRIPVLIVASVLACAMIGPRADAQTPAAAPPARPVLVIQSTPGGAQVYVDDELLGTTSTEGRLKISTLKPGKHSLRLSLDGRSYGEGQFTLVAGKTLTKAVALTEQNAANTTATPTPTQTVGAVPVSDILTWIGGNFETVTKHFEDGSASEVIVLSFQSCQVTVTDTVYTQALLNGTNTAVTGPFDLSSLRPDKIQKTVASVADTWKFELNISSINPLPWTYSIVSTMGGNPPVTNSNSSTTSNLGLHFATEAMANRQAKAWHDAIIACGGKAVSDKLY